MQIEWMAVILNGLFVGLGTAIGNYFATKHIISRVGRLEDKLKEQVNKIGRK